MKAEVTGLIGRPRGEGVTRKHFDKGFADEADSLEHSRFATFEINFESEVIEALGGIDDDDDDDIYIDQ